MNEIDLNLPSVLLVEAERNLVKKIRSHGATRRDPNASSMMPRPRKRTPNRMKQKSSQWAELNERIDNTNRSSNLAMYRQYRHAVRRETRQLAQVLQAADAKRKERSWIRFREEGELDDSRLVEGLTGERTIYRVRGKNDDENPNEQRYPKRIRFLFDLSMSMSRYDSAYASRTLLFLSPDMFLGPTQRRARSLLTGTDGRLRRSLQAACMLMESLHNLPHKFEYSIIGHNGDSEHLPFVQDGAPPRSDDERALVLTRMKAACDFCDSGDHTLESLERAIAEIVKGKVADEYIVFLLSDANLESYGITARDLTRLIRKDPRVRVFIFFIGSLGDQAAVLSRNVPPGHVMITLNTRDIPRNIKSCLSMIA